MKAKVDNPSALLERAIQAVRADEPSSATAAEARARFEGRWLDPSDATKPDAPIRSCEDVQALFSHYRRGNLAAPRALLVRNHLTECTNCREVWNRRGTLRLLNESALTEAQRTPGHRRSRAGLVGLAAAAILCCLALVAIRTWWFGASTGVVATVQAVSGALYRIDGPRADRLASGSTLTDSEMIRADTTPQSLVRLADGSTVELGERAELSITTRGPDTTLHLNRGQIIVQAAKRNAGHLYVATRDCRVAVTGTVFSVMSSLKGSRVSVVDGEVHVNRSAGAKDVLHRGDQVTTSAALARVPIEQELAWSRNLDEHLALLHELSSLHKDWDALPTPELRYASRLLELVPEDAVVYAALPNYGEMLSDGYRLLKLRLGESPVLKRWWQANDAGETAEPLDAIVTQLRELSQYLGDEVVFTTTLGSQGERMLALAEVKKPGLAEQLRQTAPTLFVGGMPLRVVGEDAVVAGELAGSNGPVLLVTPRLAALASHPESIVELVAQLSSTSKTAFEATPLGERVKEAYEQGVSLLLAADLEMLSAFYGACGGAGSSSISATSPTASEPRFITFEHKPSGGQIQNRGILSFAGPRQGIASWLAAPGPMGCLDFVTARASAVAAFLVKRPTEVLDDLLRTIPSGDAAVKLTELEKDLDLRLREDLLSALGAEFAVALDGPLLPQPAWKLVIEVQDRERLERAIETLLRRTDQTMRSNGTGALLWEQEQLGPHRVHRIRTKDAKIPFEAHYAFFDGYLVVTPSRALLSRAMEARVNGENLAHSRRFTQLLPRDGRASLSALVFQDLLSVVAGMLGTANLEASDDQKQRLQQVLDRSAPSLLALYGEADRIEMAGVGDWFPMAPEMLAMPGLMRHIFPTMLEVTQP